MPKGVKLSHSEFNVQLHLSGDNEGLKALQMLANQACEGACLSAVQHNRLLLALNELFANIHKHGYSNQGGDVECCAQLIEQTNETCLLEIKLRDFAPVLQDVSTCKGVDPSTLKERPVPGGLGMQLICATTETFEHQPLEDGNLWRLVFNLKEEKEK